jgi:D-alanyl-lipoteichoic acid acyltransferase DltB (MBOAT superfamily)
MDLFDAQWRNFRGGLPLLMAFASIQSILANLGRRHSRAAHSLVQLATGLTYVFVLHGYRLVYILGLALGNFFVSTRFAGKVQIRAVWIFNLCALVLASGTGEYWEIPGLSGFAGMTNWAHHFNMVMLKLISFGIDLGRAREAKEEVTGESYKARMESSHAFSEYYSMQNYLSYVFYCPLFLAGPIVTFNAWYCYMVKPSGPFPVREILVYALRWTGVMLLMELFTHFMYCNAIVAGSRDFLQISPKLSLAFALSLYVLFFMWMKFLLIWRFFRLWSLLNQIDCPENMNRCVFHNYSIAQFWKSWHSSFNLWLLRYVYIPLGGSANNRLFNVFVVFTFVALWHDLTWRVFHWAWIVSAIFAPELAGTYMWRKSKFFIRLRNESPVRARLVKMIAVMANMLLLMASNMVGYVFGVDGLASLLSNEIEAKSVLVCLVTLASGANLLLILDQFIYDK